jgi:hypothetical protein
MKCNKRIIYWEGREKEKDKKRRREIRLRRI